MDVTYSELTSYKYMHFANEKDVPLKHILANDKENQMSSALKLQHFSQDTKHSQIWKYLFLGKKKNI